ncbi:hypothetical protein D1BOALGB6SA_9271 [Olavius sp. associated proteobacterium Delta 1]|nr:hypothetical protein D1BOALGB6SA_9271 [Olavius sp. associated proteobacterium Delta 1]
MQDLTAKLWIISKSDPRASSHLYRPDDEISGYTAKVSSSIRSL